LGTRRGIFTVRGVLGDMELGRFSLRSDQSAPYNAFVDLKGLQSMLEMEGLANLLVGTGPLQPALAGAWNFEDAGLAFRSVDRYGIVQLESPRIYLDPVVAEQALAVRENAAGSVTYLVNSISVESNGRSTPYSFVTALSPKLGPVTPELKDDEIVVSRWLADQLSIKSGERVKVAYWELADDGSFVERSRLFVVRGIVEMDSLAAEKALVPSFPGLTDVERCEEWDIGLPLEDRRLKDPANEAYWKAYRQTPKAFVTLAAGRQMWANRFGDLMAVRFPLGETNPGQLSRDLRARIDPSDLGLAFRPVREEAARAVADSADLGQLFLGMSAFLVAASLILTAMLFAFSIEQRARESGVLLAIGFRASQVHRLYFAEGAVVAVAGSLAGIPLGYAIARILVAGLGSNWSGATAHAPIVFSATAGSAAIGAIAAAVISMASMGLTLVFQSKRSVRELVSDEPSARFPDRASGLWIAMAGLAVLGSGAIAISALDSGRPAAAYFAAGSVALIGGLAFSRWILGRLSTASSSRISPARLGVRNASRRPIRSLAAIGLLACGCFILASISSMKVDPSTLTGTGGIELYGESSIALHDDLNGEKGRQALRLTDPAAMRGVSVIQIKKREGDDASCLNLNQSLAPPLLGVDPSRMAGFAGVDWGLLERDHPEGVVPAIVGDSATATWKLKREVLDYQDVRGRPFKVKLVGAIPTRLSILQGQVIISQRDFARLFPTESGYRVFLVDAPAGNEGRVQDYLTEKLEHAGIDFVPSVSRIREFYVVESTYLAMFLALGALGLILGSAGMGILALRQILERRSELAILRCVGFSVSQLRRVVMAELGFLVCGG
ncbi:MAG TPA: FtsX-like permease family protein, partial [Planctomycetota bacterium]|nr:FtsX-like permease family protein [Planctomycetota bacterium]